MELPLTDVLVVAVNHDVQRMDIKAGTRTLADRRARGKVDLDLPSQLDYGRS